MINKKYIIQKYAQEEKSSLSNTDNETAQKIIKKAAKYNISLFQNDTLVSRLLNVDTVKELPKDLMSEIIEVFEFLIKMEEEAQLSK